MPVQIFLGANSLPGLMWGRRVHLSTCGSGKEHYEALKPTDSSEGSSRLMPAQEGQVPVQKWVLWEQGAVTTREPTEGGSQANPAEDSLCTMLVHGKPHCVFSKPILFFLSVTPFSPSLFRLCHNTTRRCSSLPGQKGDIYENHLHSKIV